MVRCLSRSALVWFTDGCRERTVLIAITRLRLFTAQGEREDCESLNNSAEPPRDINPYATPAPLKPSPAEGSGQDPVAEDAAHPRLTEQEIHSRRLRGGFLFRHSLGLDGFAGKYRSPGADLRCQASGE